MRSRTTQRERILRLLQEREGQWVPLYEILPLAAQYNTRIKELRDPGHTIQNRTEHRNGAVHSWFRLVPVGGQAKLFDTVPETPARRQEHWLEVQPQGRLSPVVNKVILIGRLGRGPEMRYTGDGTPVCNFTLATDESYTDKAGERQKKTEWHNIVAWKKLAENCTKLLSKGSLCADGCQA